MKVEPILYGERKVYTVSAFSTGISRYLRRLPVVWASRVSTGYPAAAGRGRRRRHDARGPGAPPRRHVTIARQIYDRLGLELEQGESVHVQGRAELYEVRGQLGLRATTIERIGLGEHLLALERLKRKLAAKGVRTRPKARRTQGPASGRHPHRSRRGGAGERDHDRRAFPGDDGRGLRDTRPGRYAPTAIVASLRALEAHEEVDVIVLTRGGGSFEDLLPFSDERVVRAVAACAVPVVSAVGHEQDTPLCDLAADARAATPTAAAALVVPDARELRSALDASRRRLEAAIRSRLERDTQRLGHTAERLRRAPLLLLERRRSALDHLGVRLQALSPGATLARGYAIVRTGGEALRDAAEVAPGDHLEIELASGGLGARVEEVRP